MRAMLCFVKGPIACDVSQKVAGMGQENFHFNRLIGRGELPFRSPEGEGDFRLHCLDDLSRSGSGISVNTRFPLPTQTKKHPNMAEGEGRVELPLC